jgi:hypothetical protein
MEAEMTFVWLDNQGLPRRSYKSQRFERRIDERTAGDIADALRARGIGAAALAMEHLKVDMDVALQVLAGVSQRRGKSFAAATLDRRQRLAEDEALPARLAPELAGA